MHDHDHDRDRDHGQDTSHSHDHDDIDVARLHRREYWEDRYAGDVNLWSGHVNQPVVDEVAGLAPGRALDVAAGEGGDALWLADQGWTVTALDVSENALARGRVAAEARGLEDRVSWVRADVRTWRTDERFDLVTSAYLHLPSADRGPWLAAVADLVVPGGTLLVVNHDASDSAVVERPHIPDLMASAETVAAELDPEVWEVVTAEARSRVASHRGGPPVELHDAILRACRR